MDNLITHAATPDGDEVRVEELRGEKYLVAPLVLVREKVLNGGYLSPDEIQASEHGWNGRPVTAPPNVDASGHPTDDQGEFVSANKPEVMERMKVGHLANVEYDDDLQTENDEASEHGLVGEAWVRLKSVQTVGEAAEQAAKAIAEGEPLDVSTGYFHRPVDESGEFNGVEYEQRQTDLMPDHLALLPNEEGACNWSDGCGTPRVQTVLNSLDDENDDTSDASLEANQSVGDLVRWGDDDRATQRPRIGEVVEVRESEDAEPFDDEIEGDAVVSPPAALIRLWRPNPETGEWEETDTFVAHKTNNDTLTVIDSPPDASEYNTLVGEFVRWNEDEDTPTRYGVVRDTNAEDSTARVELQRAEPDGFVDAGVVVERSLDILTEVDELPTVEAVRVVCANVLDEARRPDFDGITSSEWNAPDLEDYVDALDLDDVNEVADLTDEERQGIASHTLLGDASAETFAELQFFPVVEPETGDLNENALDAVISGRGAQADITEEQLESARDVAYDLLNDSDLFDRDLDQNVDANDEGNVTIDNQADDGGVFQTVKEYLGFDGDDAGARSTCSSGACTCGLHVTAYMTHDIDELAEQSAFDRETLEGWDEERLADLAESLNMVDDDDASQNDTSDDDVDANDDVDDAQNDTSDDSTDLPPEVEERLAELQSEVDDLRSQSEQDRRDELVEHIAQVSDHERETLKELETDALETLADDLEPYDGSYQTGANYVGQAGAGAPEQGEDTSVDDPSESGYTANVGVVSSGGDD